MLVFLILEQSRRSFLIDSFGFVFNNPRQFNVNINVTKKRLGFNYVGY